jgi:hypothetical protein
MWSARGSSEIECHKAADGIGGRTADDIRGFMLAIARTCVYPAFRIEMPAALRSISALSVFSQLNEPSLPGSRPKWP